jgi:FkbM family methyltransferase
MMKEHSNLIYDVGLFDGGDTAYYLYRGYNVIAVDANPLMVDQAKVRFSQEVGAERLTLLNVGISSTPGTATFWVSDTPEWSSFDKAIASRNGTPHRPVSVPTVPFSQLIAEQGVPYYLKIDIEGNDGLCVDALKGSKLPTYISVESECVGDSEVVSDEEATAMLESLRDVGYKRFKLVNQSLLAPVRSDAADYCMRLVNSVARGRLRIRGLCRIAARLSDAGRRSAALGFSFSPGCSGPWGDDIPGLWMTFDDARFIYLRKRRSFFSKRRSLHSFWYDWHATY